jgi:hypothetical protein
VLPDLLRSYPNPLFPTLSLAKAALLTSYPFDIGRCQTQIINEGTRKCPCFQVRREFPHQERATLSDCGATCVDRFRVCVCVCVRVCVCVCVCVIKRRRRYRIVEPPAWTGIVCVCVCCLLPAVCVCCLLSAVCCLLSGAHTQAEHLPESKYEPETLL